MYSNIVVALCGVKRFVEVLLHVSLLCLLAACGGGGGGSSSGSSANSDPDGPNPVERIRGADLSGEVTVAAYAGIDRDIESTCGEFSERNNAISSPQYISNPARIGGYISGVEGAYSNREPSPNCLIPGHAKDLYDYFQVVLVENQAVSLSLFYADSQDRVDGRLIDVSVRLLDTEAPHAQRAAMTITSEGTNTLIVPDSQDYIVELSAQEGDSVPVLYTLGLSQSVGSEALIASSQLSLLQSEFVPGEVLVRYRSPSSVTSRSAGGSRLAVAPAITKVRSIAGLADVYRLNEEESASVLSFESSSQLNSAMQEKWLTLQAIENLKQDPNVVFAEPNYLMRATGTIDSPAEINDAEYSRQWNIPMLSLPAAWQVASGEGAVVAVIDTGIHGAHADLNNNIVAGGYDFVTDVEIDGDGTDGRDNDPEDPGSTYHGSHVAGIVAGEGNSIGIRGVAYDAGVLPLRALGAEGVGSSADIAEAILYAAGLTSAGGMMRGSAVDVINLSLGSHDESLVMGDAVARAIEAGAIVVAAAGNDGTSQPFYPAAFDNVVAVSSVDERKDRSSFSNFGDYIDIAAPGGTGADKAYSDGFQDGILSTVFASEYGELRGTSMAAPHVSGVIALMKELNPAMTPSGFSTLLSSGSLTDNIDLPGFNSAQEAQFFGQGLINASKAVASAGADIPDTLIVSPAELGFVDGNTDAVLRLSNPGSDGDVQVESITPSDTDLISITPAITGSGLADYAVTIDISRVGGDIVSATIEIAYRIGGVLQPEPIEVSVFISRSAVTSATVGNLNVYLVRLQDIEEAEESGSNLIDIYDNVGGQLNNGVYSFEFSDIPPGQYFLEASTDNDGDRIWFDLGEAIGAYPLLSEFQLIDVNGEDLSELNFDVGYSAFSGASGVSDSVSVERLGRIRREDASLDNFLHPEGAPQRSR